LADALFLAEKNAIYPVPSEIAALDGYLTDFLQDKLQNPGDGSVGCSLPDSRSVATNFGRPQVYPLVFNLYHSLARIARTYGMTGNEAAEYLKRAARTVQAMFTHANEASLQGTGIPLMSYLPDLIKDLREA